jgi:uncharacterized membrane protein YqjE
VDPVSDKATGDMPTSELLERLSDQTRRLVRDEVRLARTELTEKGKRAGIGAGLFGAAGLIALYGIGVLLAALVLAIAEAIPAWAAALIVAAGLFALCGGMALTGRSQARKAAPPVPEQAVDEAKKTAQTVREHAKH